jgi:quinate/shikimate dehydrogenase (NAD+)
VLPAFPRQARCLVGLVGAEIDNPPSVQPHWREPDELGVRYRYQLTGVSHLGLGPAGIAAMLADALVLSFGATSPGRPRAAVRHAPDVPFTGRAEPGAMGTVAYARGRLTGYARDSAGGPGADEFSDVTMRHVVLLGPADPAVAHAVIGLGAERLTIVDTRPAHARALSAACRPPSASSSTQAAGPGDFVRIVADADGVIHAIPAGTKPSQLPVSAHLVRPEMWAADVIYRPLGPRLPGATRRSGCPAPSGRGTLALPVLGAFRLATGCEADAEGTFRYLAALTGTVAGNVPAATDASHPGPVKRRYVSAS